MAARAFKLQTENFPNLSHCRSSHRAGVARPRATANLPLGPSELVAASDVLPQTAAERLLKSPESALRCAGTGDQVLRNR
jgi:hypothetical protein